MGEAPGKDRKRIWYGLLSAALAAVLLYYSLRGVEWARVWTTIIHARGRARIAVEAHRDRRHRGARRGHLEFRHAESERALDDERDRPARQRVGSVIVAVAVVARYAEEERSRRRGPAVGGPR